MIERLARWRSNRTKIPFEMFDLEKAAHEARSDHRLRNIYHRGQELAWDGRTVLRELIEKHGGIHVADPRRGAPLLRDVRLSDAPRLPAHAHRSVLAEGSRSHAQYLVPCGKAARHAAHDRDHRAHDFFRGARAARRAGLERSARLL